MLISNKPHLLETQAYINACSITDTTQRKNIFAFSNGIYDLGIWNNVVFWMMRLGQNAQTGATVYSLGGLGRFHGTIVNNPARGADGFILTGTQYIDSNFQNSTDNFIVFAVGRRTSGVWGDLFFNNSLTNQIGMSLRNDGSASHLVFDPNWRYFLGGDDGSTNFKSLATSKNTTDGTKAFRNTTNIGSLSYNAPLVATSQTSIFGGRAFTANLTGNVAFGLWASNITSGSTNINTQIYSLYKSTIGQGLGLP